VLILNVDPRRPAAGFEVETTLRELPTERGRMPIRFETVRVTTGTQREVSLASIASPLLLPELPTFLYWPGGTLVGSPLFEELLPIADRLIIDSSLLEEQEASLREIGRIVANQRGPVVGDFAWRRLTPWRSLLAQFFDHPDALQELDRIEEVELIGRLPGRNGQSGLTATLLLAGWLASTLDWRAPGPMVRAKDGWRVTLRCGSGADEREVVLRIRLKAQIRSPGRILSVMLRSDDDAPQPALFRVERVSRDMVRTYSEFGGRPPVARGVPAGIFNDSDLLSKELASLGRDTIYESALRCAVTLMPEE
jgi:glucose-6-phosphate dehydrogenase assembly protein OpcA